MIPDAFAASDKMPCTMAEEKHLNSKSETRPRKEKKKTRNPENH